MNKMSLQTQSWLTIINFPSFDTKNGVLTMFECGEKADRVPFPVRRTFIMKGMKEGDRRGGHAHHATNQILIAISGSCVVELDDGAEKKSVRLDSPTQGLWLKPYMWHAMNNFSADCILLVLADSLYDEKDYIREYAHFIKIIERKHRA